LGTSGRRGHLTSTQNRATIIELATEAIDHGARQAQACDEIGISERTLQRWTKDGVLKEDQRPLVPRLPPSNKLSEEECAAIIEVVNQPAFQNLPPSQIVPMLADQGTYMASESTMYRLLRADGAQNHRGRSKTPHHKPMSTHCAIKPNSIWSWDITYCAGPVKGIFYYLYLIMDIFSREIVGWEVWEDETAEHASELIRRTVLIQNIALLLNGKLLSGEMAH